MVDCRLFLNGRYSMFLYSKLSMGNVKCIDFDEL